MQPDHKQPNILFIMPDQMRGDCLSLERHPVLLTPNIDTIGGQGTHFTRAYTTCASCIPARRSFLTGQYPATNGMVGFRGGCPITTPTLPKVLVAAGYRTAMVGRYMHQDPYEEPYGYQTRILGSTYMNDDYTEFLARKAPGSGGVKGHGVSFNGWAAKPWHLPEHLHPTNWVVQRSRELLEAHDDSGPLFLTTSFYAPHPPLIPPPFYFDRYLRQDLPPAAIGDWASPPPDDALGAGVDAHVTLLQGEALRSAQAGYFGLINHIDDQLYWLLAEFKHKSRSAKRPWLIAFSTDHGEMLGDHYFFRKCEPYEGSSRIPFLIQASPELGFRSGQRCDTPVCLEDLMPTFLAAAGADAPEGMDGRSLLPVLRGEGSGGVRDWLHGEHATCYSQAQAYHFLTDGRMKYIWRPLDGSEQLFDLGADPQELRNLAGDPGQADALAFWRSTLVERLRDRPEGFVRDGTLVAGRAYPAILPHAQR